MNLLLDTCAVLFLAANDSCVTPQTRRILEQADHVYLSAISVGELACLQTRGKIELPTHWKPWFRSAVLLNGWTVLPIDQDIIEDAYSLPDTFHADPADRILVATARFHRLTLLTTDKKIHQYPHVDSVW